MKPYFEMDQHGELSCIGAWPSFDEVPTQEASVWIFEGREELELFIKNANDLLAKWPTDKDNGN